MRIRRGRGDLPPLLDGLEFFGDLSSPNTSIVSGAVATIGDSSGRGRHFTQATAGKRPTYSASDANFGGRPSMLLDGSDDALVNAVAYGGWTARTQYIVFRQTSASADARIFSDQVGALAPSMYVNVASGPVVFAGYINPVGSGTTKVQATVLSTSYYAGFAYDMANGAAAIPRFYINGASTGAYSATGASNGASTASSTHAIGANAAGTAQFFPGYILDVLDYSVSHTTDEMVRMNQWLAWRNGL